MITYEWLDAEAKRFVSPALAADPAFRAFLKQLAISANDLKTPLSQEARYRSILEKSGDIVYVTDARGYFTSVNSVAQEITGYSRKELLSMRYTDLIEETFRPRAIKFYVAQIARELSSTYFEFPIMTRHQGIRWIGQSVQLSVNPQGETELIALAIDITRKKEEEQKLKDSNRELMLFRELMNGSTEAIVVVADEGRIFYMNNEARIHYRVRPERTSVTTIADLDPASFSAEAWAKRVEELKQAVTRTYESTFVNELSGTEQPVEITEKYVKIGDAAFIIIISRDISARKRSEEARKAQEEKYRNIITNMNLGLLEVNQEGLIQFANQSFMSMCGYDFNMIKGKDAARLFAAGEEVKKVKERAELRKKGASDMYEVLVKNREGELRWWMISGAPNYNDKGEMIGSIGIHLDITDQKRLSSELESAMMKVEEASKAKEAFLANMSHEIRTPLNGIIGMIRDLEKEPLLPKQRKYVSNAGVASQHLLSVLNNVLDMSKIEEGQLLLENRPFQLADTLRDVKRMMNSSARARGLFLGMSRINIEGFTYMGDSLRIRQVLLNLVGNAIKFTEEGGVFVECTAQEKRQKEHVITFVVEDTGVGMEKEFQANLFSKFSQEDATISRRYGGSGLGMAISHELITLMNGSISVSSEKGSGTVITVRLTLPLADTQQETVTRKDHHADLRGMRVLLVEDNDFNLAVAARSLKRFGCTVTVARNGQEAVDILEKGSEFEAVLMDMQMPVLDGIAATKIIRERLKNDVPVIALTANAFKAEIEACRAAGMNDYITKPYEESVMAEVLSLYRDGSAQKTIESMEQTKMYDLASLHEISDGDQGFIKEMIVLFIQQALKTAAEIREGVKQSNHKMVAASAHRIKASIDSLAILALRDPIRKLETLAGGENSDPTTVSALASEVSLLLEQVAEQMRVAELSE